MSQINFPKILSIKAIVAGFKRLWRWIPPILFVLLFVGTTTFAFQGNVDEFAPLTVKILYHLALTICFLCLWITCSHTVKYNTRPDPKQVFWQIIVAILTIWILMFLVFQIQDGFLDFNTPTTPIAYIKSALLGTLFATLSFILVQRLSYLVQFRRTRRSEKNWRLFILSLGLGFIVCSPFHPYFSLDSSPLEVLFLIVLGLVSLGEIILIFINSVRLTWIVHLSFRQKMTAIGLGTVLMCMTLGTLLTLFRPDIVLGSTDYVTAPPNFLPFYSLPLTKVVIVNLTFGFIYALTSVLSLIFHLPTIGDYQRGADEMAAMQALSLLVRESADPGKLHHWVVSTTVDAGRGKAAWLTVQDLDSGSLKPQIVAAYNIDTSIADESCDLASIHREASQTRKLVYIPNTVVDRRTPKCKANGILSLLAIPLETGTEVLGTLFVSHEIFQAFENDDIESIVIFATQATLVLENVRLLESKIERERLASELSIARKVQRRLLPQTMPQLSYLSLAASSTPALEVGGDYYDLLEVGEGKLAFIVADVSGKGTSAAFYMAEMQGIFQAVARIAPGPSDFLYHANQALGESLEKSIFVTAIYGLIDCNSGHMSIARAGHSPAVLVDVSGNAKLLRSGGLGIGLDRSELFSETLEIERLTFQPGDLIVLYTDGVVESRNTEGEEFGYDRLVESIKGSRYERAQGVHDAVRKTVDQFLGLGKNYDDDLTLLVIKWHGHEPTVFKAGEKNLS
ncbi:MAG: SpoIIE family protein phosphatase [Bacteroidetes bacterium]|nr:SpoIIE family protein phosphatase [Bacteroidota bacterium]MCY4205582.1 SpoIIE family protein phosphatase [Bacteroidota bacterium]